MNTRVRTAAISAGLIVAVMLGSTALAFAAKGTLTPTAGTTSGVSETATSTPPPPGAPPDGPGRGHGRGGGRGGMFGVGLIEVVAKLTGETTATVMSARQSGTSFAEMASEKDVGVEEIVDLAMHAPAAALESQVSDGLIKQAEADQILADLQTRLTEEVKSTDTRGPDGSGPGRGAPPIDQAPTGQPSTGEAPTTDSSGTGTMQ